ncbi:MAG TPA: acyl-CoA desaturase [Cyclobacteriaceae bacterium]|jgi:linoleoyl-CoA desaturase|nr:acyl-CoA desaturase [Cyclobacteriaceae bacterium]
MSSTAGEVARMDSTLFFKTLKDKVDAYFENNKLSRAGEYRLLLKSIFQILTAVSLYVVLVFFTPPWWLALVLAALLGVNFAALGFNVMHEGGHQSFSHNKWINSAAGYVLNILGGNIYFWKVKHNVNHHTFTSIDGLDSDINVEPFMRLHPNQRLLKAHRFQHIYFVVLYGISYVVWVFYEDFVKYFTNRIAPHMKPMTLSIKEHLIFWITKIMYVTLLIVVPIFFVGWLKAMIGFLVMTFVCGLFISLVFQLAHVVEINHFPCEKKVVGDWAVHQVSTTANFDTSNKALSWLLGGLNFQIEHHLFPKVSHIHYSAISKLVKETCHDFEIAYHEYGTMFSAMASHVRYLHKMGAC